MKRRSLIISIVVFALFVLLLGARLIAPSAVKSHAIALVRQNCASCTFEIQSVDLSLLPLEVTFGKVRLIHGDAQHTKFEASAPLIVVALSPGALFWREIHLTSIQVQSPRVIVTEGSLRNPPSRPSNQKSAWTFAIDKVTARNGQFKYVHLYKPENAVITVTKIEASGGPWGTTAELIPATSYGKATGQLEKSGNFTFKLAVPVAAKSLTVDVDIEIANQNMADLNAYFQRSDGIKIQGSLPHGHATSSIRGNTSKTSVNARYSGLTMEFEAKAGERGPIAAFLWTLIGSTQLDVASKGKEKAEQPHSVVLERKPGETIILFILRGMRDAALKVATS